ncbi:MAG: glycosyltransferase, partial [Lachnospiraceae bacterium]|nr:glycosyltransferase [Lachnospiraceae bacterium]
YAAGEYVMWVDADHIIDDEAMEKLLELKKELAKKRYGSVCVKYLSPDNLKVPVSFHMIMRRDDDRKWAGAVHERYPLKEPVLYSDITIRHRERKDNDNPVNLKSIIYADYIKKISDEEFREYFWLAMQCYVDLIFAGEKKEAERILRISTEKKPPLDELLRTCLLAGNNFLYWKRYEDALGAYELFFKAGEFSAHISPLKNDIKKIPPEIKSSPLFRMLLLKMQKCAYECGEIPKAVTYNDILLEAFPGNVSAGLNRRYYDTFAPVSLSVCMIVRDEEPVLERILSKVKLFADELIIVDTGSVDRSKEIAKRYTEKIYDFVWNDDFAAARNHSYEKATCDYIMWLDADDDLENEDIEKLKYLKQHFPRETDVLLLYYDDDTDDENILSHGGLVRDRWIRRSLNAKWDYPIHEAIRIDKNWNVLCRPDIRIFHRKEHVNEEHRNIRIFERKFEEGFTMDSFNRAYYIRELAVEKRYDEARDEFEKLWKEGSRRDIDYALLFYILTMKALKQKTKLCETLEEYLERFGAHEMVFCNIGDIYRGQKRYEDAVLYYRMARGLQIDVRDRKAHLSAYCEFLPWLGLAKTYLCMGDTQNAKDAIQHAQRSYPDYPELKIIKLYLENLDRIEPADAVLS